MQKCRECREDKPADAFYVSNKSRCKECVKAGVRANRIANVDYYRAYDRARAWLPDRVMLRKKRAARAKSDPAIRARDAEHKKRWSDEHAIKRRAHTQTGNAIRDGRLVPQPCERCGHAINVQAHHEDYSEPLDVIWLCPPCHGTRHREINEARRQDAA